MSARDELSIEAESVRDTLRSLVNGPRDAKALLPMRALIVGMMFAGEAGRSRGVRPRTLSIPVELADVDGFEPGSWAEITAAAPSWPGVVFATRARYEHAMRRPIREARAWIESIDARMARPRRERGEGSLSTHLAFGVAGARCLQETLRIDDDGTFIALATATARQFATAPVTHETIDTELGGAS